MSRLPNLGPRGEGWLAAQVVLIAAVGFAPRLDPWRSADAGLAAAFAVIGSAISTAGVSIGILAALELIERRSFSTLPLPPEDGVLVESGLYARVLHPLYSGVALSGLGWAIAWLSPLAFVALLALVVVLYLKAAREEVWLRHRFPAYAAYCARTKRLIPGLL